MKKTLGVLITLIVAACHPVSASAGSTIVMGKVVDVKPVYTQVNQNIPKDVCQQVQVPIYANNGNYSNGGNAILGAIIGGVIGNQFGKGDGNKAATAVGAAIGAVKGSQTGKQNNNIVGYKNVTQCHKEYSTRVKHIVNEYDITYNVNGMIITKRVNKAVGNNMYVGKTQRFRVNYQLMN